MASRSAHLPSHASYQAGRDWTPERKCLQQARKQGAATCQSAEIPQTARTPFVFRCESLAPFSSARAPRRDWKIVWFYPGPASQLEYGRDIQLHQDAGRHCLLIDVCVNAMRDQLEGYRQRQHVDLGRNTNILIPTDHYDVLALVALAPNVTQVVNAQDVNKWTVQTIPGIDMQDL